MSNQPLFMPYRMGNLDLPNRIVMAPLTRMRAQSQDHVPTALQAEYYAQRASAGLIIAEATAEGLADLVAFGRPYIANPDLVRRFAENAPPAEVDWETVYTSGPRGYSDYATYRPWQDDPTG
jgi:2,4-dienoyl-CoA reductase-like NADH-dependent reductase (Old Yellow Enzyme family)